MNCLNKDVVDPNRKSHTPFTLYYLFLTQVICISKLTVNASIPKVKIFM